MRSPILALIAGTLMTSPLGAQDYSGTYTTPNQAGGVVTLTILQTAAGQVTGSLAGPGVSFALNGLVQEASLLGTLSGDMGGVYFAAEMSQGGLQVTLIEPGPDNQPNYDSAQTMMFTRAGPAAATPPMGGQPSSSGGPLGAPGAARSSVQEQGGGDVNRLDGWNIAYQVPGGWNRGQDVGRMAVYGHMSQAGMISVTPGLYADFNEVVADVGAAFQAMGMAAQPVEGPTQTTIAGMQAISAVLASQDQMGQLVQTRVVGVLTGHGTGLIVSGMTTPQQMAQLRQVVDQVAATVTAQAPITNQQAVAALAGRWMYYDGKASGVTSPTGGSSRSVEQYVTFDGGGRYQFQSSASVSVTGGLGGMAGGASSSSDQGTYTVIGSTLVVKGQQGQQAFQLQILGDRIVADGRTYLRAN